MSQAATGCCGMTAEEFQALYAAEFLPKQSRPVLIGGLSGEAMEWPGRTCITSLDVLGLDRD